MNFLMPFFNVLCDSIVAWQEVFFLPEMMLHFLTRTNNCVVILLQLEIFFFCTWYRTDELSSYFISSLISSYLDKEGGGGGGGKGGGSPVVWCSFVSAIFRERVEKLKQNLAILSHDNL
jgi:hypothetical protein